MGKNKNKAPQGSIAFSFGDPEPVLSTSISDYLGSYLANNGKYYQTPVPWRGLARLLRANAYHGPTLEFKVNVTMAGFIKSSGVHARCMRSATTDYMVFTNAYFQKLYNGYGEVAALKHLPAINIRRLKDDNHFGMFDEHGQLVEFKRGEILHLKNYDVSQDIYGMPFYLGAIQSMLLNEDATLFRRRYYKNGAHLGYIFYSSSANLAKEDQLKIQGAVQGAKGLGNFKNMFLHFPNGREKDIQILPVGDFSTKDELEKIKNISRDDIIAAHRIPPALANIIPTAPGGLGDIEKVDRIYKANEIAPIQEVLLEINDVLPRSAWISFPKPPALSDKK